MTTQTVTGARFTLWDGIRDLGWFSWLFALVVAGPSVLSLGQTIFVDHKLIAALQWIVDGYNGVMDVLGAIFEPLLQPLIRWINSYFNWSLELQPHWRPLFVLSMIVCLSGTRTAWHAGLQAHAIKLSVGSGIAALIACLIVGVAPLSAGWWAHGLAAAAPPALVIIGLYAAAGQLEWDDIGIVSLIGGVMFAVGAAISFIPIFAESACILALSLLVFIAGLWWLMPALAKGERFNMRVGLTILGGFAVAAIIVAADAALKTWGPAELATVSALAR